MRRLLGGVLLFLLLPGWCTAGLGGGLPEAPPSAPEEREELVFGALRFYKSAAENRSGYERLITGLSERGVHMYPRVVLGSYLDLVDWITRGRVDIAWLPPMSYLRAVDRDKNLHPLATVLRLDGQKQITDSTVSMLVMRKGEWPADLKALNGKRVVFGAELSTSGFLLPLYFLKSNGVSVAEPYTYAGSQQQAVELLLGDATHPPSADVIGISELTLGALSEDVKAKLESRTVLDDNGQALRLPNDALVARAGISPARLERLTAALLSMGEASPRGPDNPLTRELGAVGFRAFDPSKYERVKDIADRIVRSDDRYSIKAALDSIRWDIELKSELARLEKQDYAPRLALVLAGGGAAGSYQAGAASAVCKAMGEVGMKPDIVVGTSVGAINGTAVAMGRADVLDKLWAKVSLDTVLSVRQEDRPLGAWKLALIRVAQRAPAALALVLAATMGYLELLLFALVLRPLGLTLSRGLSVIGVVAALSWLMERGFSPATGLTLVALAAAHLVVVRQRAAPSDGGIRAKLHAVALAAVLIVVPAQVHRAFSEREALFATDNLYRLLGTFFLELRGKPVPADDAGLRAAVTGASAALMQEGLAHTLVISTTDYQRQVGHVFYATKDPEVDRRAKERGFTAMASRCPGNLIDVVVASAAVFPVLEPCTLELADPAHPGVPREKVRLIDGGFVHNNPVQLAVDLGATHVLIVKPSADVDYVTGEPSLLSSLFSFFGWLIARSQTEDLRARDEVMSFLLQPSRAEGAPVIEPLEFDGHWNTAWGTADTPAMTLRGFLEVGRRAAVSSHHGFQLHSRGTFRLPPAPKQARGP